MRDLLHGTALDEDVDAAAGFLVALDAAYGGAVFEGDGFHDVEGADFAAGGEDGGGEFFAVGGAGDGGEVGADPNAAAFAGMAGGAVGGGAEEDTAAFVRVAFAGAEGFGPLFVGAGADFGGGLAESEGERRAH